MLVFHIVLYFQLKHSCGNRGNVGMKEMFKNCDSIACKSTYTK